MVRGLIGTEGLSGCNELGKELIGEGAIGCFLLLHEEANFRVFHSTFNLVSQFGCFLTRRGLFEEIILFW